MQLVFYFNWIWKVIDSIPSACRSKMCCTPIPQERYASTGNYPSLSMHPAVYVKVARSPHFFSTLWWMKSCVMLWQSMKCGSSSGDGWKTMRPRICGSCSIPFDTAESAQLILDRLARAVIPFGMCFAPSKCKVMYQDWDSSEPPLTLKSVRLGVVDRFTYLGSSLSNNGSIGSEINAYISKARVAFTNLLHLWCKGDVSLPVKGRMYNAAVRSVLLYKWETWSLRQNDVHRLIDACTGS